jgi:Halobacterial output domain 1
MSQSPDSLSTPSIQNSSINKELITTAVITAVTDANGTKPATPLYEAIDPDALEDLYHHASPKVSFEYAGYSVTIHTDRTVSVSELNT